MAPSAILPPAHPATVRPDPFGARRRWCREGQREDGDSLTDPAPAADGHDLLRLAEVDPLHDHWDTENHRLEREPQILLQHRQETGSLLILAVGIDRCIGNEAVQLNR